MSLALETQFRAYVSPVVTYQQDLAWCRRVRVHLADGRWFAPSASREPIAPEPWGSDVLVWDTLREFATNPLLTRPDGKPSSPTAYQQEALAARQRQIAILMGVGAGKTIVGAFKLVECALCNPGGRSLIVGPSNKALWLNTASLNGKQVPKFEAFLPGWAIAPPKRTQTEGLYGRHTRHGFYEIQWRNGHKTSVLTADVKSKAHERTQGPDVSGIWFEEASTMGQRACDTILERLRDESGVICQAWYTTSLDEPGWLERVFFDPSVDRQHYGVVRASTEDADFRSPEYFEMLRRQYTPEQYARKVRAELVYYEGLVYGDHLPARIEDPTWLEFTPKPGLPIWLGIDFGVRQVSLVFGQEFSVNGRIVDVIFDEASLADASAEDAGHLIRLRSEPYRLQEVFTDYSSTSEPDRRILRACLRGVRVKPAITDENRRYYRVRQGVNLVLSRCRDHDGRRHLFLAKSLFTSSSKGYDNMTLREALAAYREPCDKNRIHILDALRYYILGRHGPRASVEAGGRYGQTARA